MNATQVHVNHLKPPPQPTTPTDYIVKEATYTQWAQAFAQFQKTLAVRSNAP